jgi:hypothetical protein
MSVCLPSYWPACLPIYLSVGSQSAFFSVCLYIDLYVFYVSVQLSASLSACVTPCLPAWLPAYLIAIFAFPIACLSGSVYLSPLQSKQFLAFMPFSSTIHTVGLTDRQAGDTAGRKTERQTDWLTDRQTLQYLPVLYCSAAFQADKQACSQAGRQVSLRQGRQAVGKAGLSGRQAVGKEGIKDRRKVGIKPGMQADRNSDGQTNAYKDRCANIHTDIQKYRLIDIHRQTGRQWSEQWRKADRQIDKCTKSRMFTNILYKPAVHTGRQTDRLTDRTDEQRKTNRLTDR